MATYVKIQTVTVGVGGASTIDFTSIPSTYTDLQILCSLKTNYSGGQWSQVSLRFNGSSTSYSIRNIYGSGSSASSGTDVTTTGGFATTGGTGGTSIFASNSIYIPNYTSSNFKSYSVESAPEMNNALALMQFGAGIWSDTAAINAVSLVDVNGSFVQHSTATLYGIKSS